MAKFIQKILPSVTITGIADRGKAVGRHEGQVVFVEGAVPGDVADVRVTSKKKGVMDGRVEQMVTPSPDRVKPFCIHFGTCGGCKWQHLDYNAQLRHKQETVENALLRIGKVEVGEYLPIMGSAKQSYYRNKLEFTFSNRKWLTEKEMGQMDDINRNGLGFHLPGHFDKVLDISECHLQPEPSDAIRQAVRDYSLEHGFTHYNVREHVGFMRNIIIRVARTGETMVTVVFGEDEPENRIGLLDYLVGKFPNITSLNYVINTKLNDTIYDLPVHCYHGTPFIMETLGAAKFKIGPKSFFQTNTAQAEALYQTALDFAGLTGTENVYDLYTGLGSIACFVAGSAKQVVGIEEVEPAVADARENAALNGFDHLHFYAGDVKALFNGDLLERHGRPDVIITDPPRAGMHENVVNTLLEVAAPKIVYVSCNPATQARDLNILAAKYDVVKSRAVDMFPQTHHIENVTLLVLR